MKNQNNIDTEYFVIKPINKDINIQISVYKESQDLGNNNKICTEIIFTNKKGNKLLIEGTDESQMEAIYYKEKITIKQIEDELIPYYKENSHLIKL